MGEETCQTHCISPWPREVHALPGLNCWKAKKIGEALWGKAERPEDGTSLVATLRSLRTQQCLALCLCYKEQLLNTCLSWGRDGERGLRRHRKTRKERKEMGWKSSRKPWWRPPSLVGNPEPHAWSYLYVSMLERTQLPGWVQSTGRARLWTLISSEVLGLVQKWGSSWLMGM